MPVRDDGGISEEDKFLFDLRGYVILRSVYTPEECQNALSQLDTLSDALSAVATTAASVKVTVPGEIRINGLLGQRPSEWVHALDHPRVLPYVKCFLGVDNPQLAHSWAIAKPYDEDADACGWHRGISSQEYSYHDGQIECRMVNTSHMLTDNNAGDGGLRVVPGSHKANISLKWNAYGLDFPGSVELYGNAGDVVVFSEGLLHSPIPRQRPGRRANVYFNFIHPLFNIAMRSPENLSNFYVPKVMRETFSAQQQSMLQWMDFVKDPEGQP